MGALPGEHIVKISTFQAALDPDEGAGNGATPMETIPGRAEEIPAKYRKSPLRVTVERGSNTIDLTLDAKK